MLTCQRSPLLLVASAVVAGAAAWAIRESSSAPAPATIETVRVETVVDSGLQLPDDPVAVVLSLSNGIMGLGQGERQPDLAIRADGSMTVVSAWKGGRSPLPAEFSISVPELEDLLRFIVIDKHFFDMAADQIQLDPKVRARAGPFLTRVLRIQANGRQHEVVYAFLENALPTPSVENLRAILARIEQAKARAIGAAVELPDDPATPVVTYVRSGGDVVQRFQVLANGTLVKEREHIDRAIEGQLSTLEVQDLLRYIVRDQRFFDIKANQFYQSPEKAANLCSGASELHVHADGKKHAVTFERQGNPATEEGKRLNAILDRLRQARTAGQGTTPRATIAAGEKIKAPTPPAMEEESPVWTVLEPQQLKSSKGTTLTKQADNSILASGANPFDEDYIVTAQTALQGITAIRLELLTDPSLPRQGPGRSAINGNLVLHHFNIKAAPRNKPESVRAVGLKSATADFSQQNYTIDTVVNGQSNAQVGGWAIDPQEGRKHVAIFELKDPIRDAGGSALTITLAHRHGNRQWIHNIGRFRLSVTTIKPPFPFQLQDLTADDLARLWSDLGSADADRATQAADSLFHSGRAVPFLKAQLKPDKVKVNGPELARWISELDDNDFQVRENATKRLEKLGPLAAPALLRALPMARSLEAQRRLERLLEKLSDVPEVVRPQRAVEVLVRVASPQARALLESLAKGSSDAVLTEAALGALPRLVETVP